MLRDAYHAGVALQNQSLTTNNNLLQLAPSLMIIACHMALALDRKHRCRYTDDAHELLDAPMSCAIMWVTITAAVIVISVPLTRFTAVLHLHDYVTTLGAVDFCECNSVATRAQILDSPTALSPTTQSCERSTLSYSSARMYYRSCSPSTHTPSARRQAVIQQQQARLVSVDGSEEDARLFSS